MGRLSSGKIGIPIPAFNEYVRCFHNCEKVEIISKEDSFGLDVQTILDTIDKVDMLVLVNPDNPSGFFIESADMMKIISKCKSMDVRCIIDESFVDFAEKEKRYTLLQQELLEEYPNLVVIKSISKSYGVPGLRLGVLASGDEDLLKRITDYLAIWNINSLAEYFLEIMPLYIKEYINACNKLGEERKRFAKKLSEVGYLTVYPSQANYILCKVTGIPSRELATTLIEKYNILIKDLSLKSGFSGKQYVRIAIRTEEENDILINALKQINEKL